MSPSIKEAAIHAPPAAVAAVKVTTGLTLPEWASVVVIVYTIIVAVRLVLYTLDDFGWITLPRRKTPRKPRKTPGGDA